MNEILSQSKTIGDKN